jgi:hypothetical protein
MGDINILKEGTPTTPGTNTATIFADTNDFARVKGVHDDGRVDFLSENQSYNYLINGGMDFIQRWSPTLSTNTQTTQGNRYYNADRWAIVSQTTSLQVGRIDSLTTAITGSVTRYYGQYKQITGAGKAMVCQFLEYKDTANLRGKTVRLQIKVATGAWGSGSALRMGLIQNNVSATADTIATTFVSAFGANSTDPTLGTNLAYVAPLTTGLLNATLAGAAGTSALQIANPGASATFLLISGLFVVPTNCVNIGVALWTDSQMSVNDVLNIAEAQLISGQGINDWNPLSYQQEKERALRLCESSFPFDVAPVQNNGVNTGEMKWTAGIVGAGAERSPAIQLAVPKRITIASGNVTFYNPATSNAQVRDETAGGDCSATAFVAGSDRNFAVTCTGNAGGVVGGLLGLHFLVDVDI